MSQSCWHKGLLGHIVLGIGACVLGWCEWAFYYYGRSTLAPWSPPVKIVTNGLYRFSRNPMYIGVLLVVAGWALAYSSWILAAYDLILALAFHLRVIWGEEPTLAKTFGQQWRDYLNSVPRWFGHI